MAKPRQPIREEYPGHDGTTLVCEVRQPTWDPQHFVEFDRAHGKDGLWVRALDEVFGPEWLKLQKDRAHIISRAMSGWSQPMFERLLADAAEMVLAVQSAKSGASSIIKRLQVHEEYRGAMFEAKVARFASEAGLEFLFEDATTGESTFDIRVVGERPLQIEVKSRELSERAWRLKAFASDVSSALGYEPLRRRFILHWNESVVRPLEGRERLRAARVVGAEILAGLPAISGGGFGRIDLGSYGHVEVSPLGKEEDAPYRVDFAFDENRDAERLAKPISKAAQQLPPDHPSVVFVCAEKGVVEPDAATTAIRELLEAEGDSFPHVVAAVLLISSRGLGPLTDETWPVPNPHSTFDASRSALPQVISPSCRSRFPIPSGG